MSTSMPYLKKRRIHCPQCRRQICVLDGTLTFAAVLCIICQAENRGEVLPAYVKAQIMSGSTDVTYNDPNYDPILEKNTDTDEARAEMQTSKYNFRVLRRKVVAVAKSLLEATVPQSKQIAQSKKRRRVFDGDLDV